MRSTHGMTRRQALAAMGKSLGMSLVAVGSLREGLWAADAEPAPALKVDAQAAARYDLAALRKMLQAAVDSQKVPCCSLLLLHKDKVVFKEAFGWADVEKKKPLTTDSICHLASSTKWITAAGMMALVDEGKIVLDDPIGKYFPAFKDMPIEGSDAKGNPTLRQCFSCTHGMPNSGLHVTEANQPLLGTIEAIAKSPKVLRLQWKPGAKYDYHNTGMQIVGGVVEKVSGKPFEQYLRERILDPVGMNDTTFNPKGDQLPRVATIYSPKKDGGFAFFRGPQGGKLRSRSIGGGLYSTLDDYARFLQMYMHDGAYAGKKVLSPKAIHALTSDQTAGAPVVKSPYQGQKGYALGAAVMEVDADGKPVVLADGGAFGTCCWIDRQRDLVAISFTQYQLRNIYGFVMTEVPKAFREAVDSARGK